nr:7896_t:CDS:2 [Entrophospora candida]
MNCRVDIFLEGKKIPLGNLHPVTKIIQKIYELFLPLCYQIVESSEVETEEINFDKLNMPPDHPARGIHGTFYLNNNLLLHTYTFNSQDEDDATHTHQFTQIEGFVVSHNISFSHLKGTLNFSLQRVVDILPLD